ncbi:permease [Paenibacillus mendelii]|uniref:Permease n=1 Tax=Paenibacillus mendelii TaxID=206163 RepID=A0ABV6JIU9_9BACL|nr:permease [Paenibacillus mendelii]MCQ6558771.1 permease [Paenibacillus mendelii]
MKYIYRLGTPLIAVICLILLAGIISDLGLMGSLAEIDSAAFQSFKILFISILLEAIPFILIGVLFSALLQVFISDAVIARLTPKNPAAGILFGSLLGLLLPLCECGMIPVVRRLIRKGMPAYIGIIFIFAGPIINPVVFTSTFTAFRAEPAMAYSRLGLAFVVCVILGMLLYRFMKGDPLKRDAYSLAKANNGLASIHEQRPSESPANHSGGLLGRFGATMSHASDEFFDIGKYLIFGAFLAALVQTFVDREVLTALSGQSVTSSAFMMGFAFLLSLCSTSDAFVASSFTGIFRPGALLAFLVFGPMVDLKSTLMLLSAFRTKVVLAVTGILFILVLAGSILAERLLF